MGMPSQSPTYGLPMLSSFPLGVHSPEKSICANAGTAASRTATHKRMMLRILPPENPSQTASYYTPVTASRLRGFGEPYANGPLAYGSPPVDNPRHRDKLFRFF